MPQAHHDLAPDNGAEVEESARRAQCADMYEGDRKSTRLNSSHSQISYAVFCLKKKKQISQIFDGYQESRVGLQRIGELLRTPSSIASNSPNPIPISHRLPGRSTHSNITLQYH